LDKQKKRGGKKGFFWELFGKRALLILYKRRRGIHSNESQKPPYAF